MRRQNTSQDQTEEARPGERIAKVMARSGVCSRRDAERLIAEQRVRVDGELVTTPAIKVIASQTVSVDGKDIPKQQQTRLWKYHKPQGQVTSHRDPQQRPTVFSQLPAALPRVISVGRLDISSEGLLLLTNDGELSRHLELPSTGWARRYRVRLLGKVEQADLDRLKKGVTVEGVSYGPIDAKLDRAKGANAWVTVSLREGKNREVRRVMEHLGLRVNRLIRTSYGPFQLGKLRAGDVEEIPQKVLQEQLGAFLRGSKGKT